MTKRFRFLLAGCLGVSCLLAPSALAATPGWEVQIININEQIFEHTTAESVLDSNGAGFEVTSNAKKVYPAVDLRGAGLTQLLPFDFPYPDGTSSQAGNDLALRAKANVTIPAGTWTVAFGSSDGGQLTMPNNVAFHATFGENPTAGQGVGLNQIRYERNRGYGWTGGTFTAAAPISGEIVASAHKRTGDGAWEVAVAPGPQPAINSSFAPLSNGTFGWSVVTNSGAPAIDTVIKVGGDQIGSLTPDGPVLVSVKNDGTRAAGLTQRYYNSPNQGNFDAASDVAARSMPAVLFDQSDAGVSQWWTGAEPAVAGYAPKYHSAVIAGIQSGKFSHGTATNLDDYLSVLTGQIFIEKSGTFQFKDGMGGFASMRIDVNGNGAFDDGEWLINDNKSTSFDGAANDGSKPVSRTFSVPSEGAWRNIEIISWAGAGTDSANLMWDYDPATQTVGGNQAFPPCTDKPPADITLAGIPTSYFSTFGVGIVVSPTLVRSMTYEFDVLNRTDYDQIVLPNGPSVSSNPLSLQDAHLRIKSIGNLRNGDSIRLVNGPSSGTASFVFPEGTQWDTSRFYATGEVTLVSGGLVPEPASSWAMVSGSLALLMGLRRRRA
ncbi:MAG: hypothetical protein U0795_12065 [Pirellulales bacterium]